MLGCSHSDKLTYYFINCVSNYDVSIEWRAQYRHRPELLHGATGSHLGEARDRCLACYCTVHATDKHEFMKNDKKNKYINSIIYCGTVPDCLYLYSMKKMIQHWL